MKKFELPEIEVIKFSVEDVVTTSTTTLPSLEGLLVGDCV